MNDARKIGDTAASPSVAGVICAPRAGVTSAQPYNLLILSDIRFLREGLAEILARDGAFRVAGSVADISDALSVSCECGVQIVLIDAALPDGLAAARRFYDLKSGAHVVALALAETEADVIAWVKAGATGYIPRSVALSDFVAFLKEIASGQQACSTRVAAGLLRWVARASRGNDAPLAAATAPELTAREAQVVGLICAGLSNKEISRRLNIGLATTKTHIHNLLGKLALQRRGQVARWSRDHAPHFVVGVISAGHLSTASPPSIQTLKQPQDGCFSGPNTPTLDWS